MGVKKISPVDFETESIEKRPVYPPVPVGVALEIDGRSEYMAWGHPCENNCTKAQAIKELKSVYRTTRPVFHNAAFDIYVGHVHLGLPMLSGKDFEDTLFLAYLHDPRDLSLSLKPLAEKYLDMPAKEQDKLREWIIEHIYGGKKDSKKNPWGAHIAEAPGKLVGTYAKGDIIRTKKLFNYFFPYIEEQGMVEAYEREKDLVDVFEHDMSQVGLKVRTKALQRDTKIWVRNKDEAAAKIRKIVKCKDLNVDSDIDLADAMESSGNISEWVYTEKGNRSVSKVNLPKACSNKKLNAYIAYYNVMGTFISTFANNWLDSALNYGGRVYPSFNQVRSPEDWSGRKGGTRTGRPSSYDPNFFNIPRNQDDADPFLVKLIDKELKGAILPWMRNYIVPDDGCWFGLRDYNQQELRILAHFEEGLLFTSYLENPRTKVHHMVGDLIYEETGHRYPHKHVKVVNFGVVYGMGVPGIQLKTNSSWEEAKALKEAHGIVLPGVKDLSKSITKWTRKGNPIYTWGGREYYAEPPKMVGNRKKDFYYKMLNYVIQGSAADCTKEAMRRYNQVKHEDARMALQVYDEIVGNFPKKLFKQEMLKLKDCMESVEFDVPMLTDGKIGKVSWGEAIDYKD